MDVRQHEQCCDSAHLQHEMLGKEHPNVRVGGRSTFASTSVNKGFPCAKLSAKSMASHWGRLSAWGNSARETGHGLAWYLPIDHGFPDMDKVSSGMHNWKNRKQSSEPIYKSTSGQNWTEWTDLMGLRGTWQDCWTAKEVLTP